MELLTRAIKGTQDILPDESTNWRFVETTLADIAKSFGFSEIRTPVFEHTELFSRGVGDTTDVVQKEMYTFDDKGGRSITLRPEGTAGAMRSYLENGLFNEASPTKVFYQLTCYRYEKPQAGRLREFHQFGVECFGAGAPAADAEIISLGNEIFSFFGVEGVELQINSIGCKQCRAKYHEALKAYFEQYKDVLCDTCLSRLDRNPMRILDCKNPECAKVAENAPVIRDYLCDDCKAHFEKVKKYLSALNIAYTVNPRIVRGLDYYTGTVFEFVVTDDKAASGTVLGGGRYDGLAEELGGSATPALGFAMGMERFMLLLKSQNIELPAEENTDLYIVSVGDEADIKAASIALALREEGICASFDTVGRSFKAQMKYANKIKAEYIAVIGDDEIKSGTVKIKRMEDGTETPMKLDDLPEQFGAFEIHNMTKDLESECSDLEGIDLSAVIDKFGGKF